MEIKPGMYVRTKLGIKKIYDINEKATKWKYRYKLKIQDGDDTITLGSFSDDEVLREPSYNIKDLIQLGDIVEWMWLGHGYYGVNEITGRSDAPGIGVYPEEYDGLLPLKDIFILNVLTYEQFKHNRFNVEEGV